MTEAFDITRPKTAFVLIGGSCSGKTTWCRSHLQEHQILGLDKYREALNGRLEWHQWLNQPAAALQNAYIEAHAQLGTTIAIDGTNLDGKFRREMAKKLHELRYVVVYVMFEDTLNIEECVRREEQRRTHSDIPQIPLKAFERFAARYQGLSNLEREADYIIDSKTPITWNADNHFETDRDVLVVGDLHDMFPKLREVLREYHYEFADDGTFIAHSELSPFVVFLGDYTDRGTHPIETVRAVKSLVHSGNAVAIRGNHDDTVAKLMNTGQRTKSSPNSIATVRIFDEELDSNEFEEFRVFFNSLPTCITLENGNGIVFVSHAGVPVIDTVDWNTWRVPDNGTRQLMLRGWKTNERDSRGYQKLLPVSKVRHNHFGNIQFYGHVNQSEELEGEFKVPHHLGYYGQVVGLESHIENGPEYPVGVYLLQARSHD